MEKVIGIRFRKGGKIYHFDPGEYTVRKDEYVIVNTEQGIGLGQVVEPPCPKDPRIHPQDIKKIERMATEDEIRQLFANSEIEVDAKSFCMEKIAAHEQGLIAYATKRLQDVPGLRIVGTAAEKAGVISFVLDGKESEGVGAALNQYGIAVRSGHHCAQPVLRRFGLESTVRPSFALYNTYADIDALAAALQKIQSGANPYMG